MVQKMMRATFAWLAVVTIVGIAPIAWADSPPGYLDEFGGFACCGLEAPNGGFFSPNAAAVSPAGTLYVADTINDRVQYFNLNGVYLGKWGGLSAPHGIAVAPDGTVLVSDSGNDRIVRFTSTGVQLDAWGTTGSGPGEFNYPWGITTDAQGEIYVADNGNDRIQWFRPNGTYATQWGGTGTAEGQLNCPTGVVASSNGKLYVADACNSRVQRFTTSGQFEIAWGSFGTGAGQFTSLYGMTIDLNGAVYVADSGNGRIQKFNRDGIYMGEWSETSTGNFLQRPVAVAASSGAGFTLFVLDVETHMVYRYAYAATGVPGDRTGLVPPTPVRVFPNPAAGRTRIAFAVETPGGAEAHVRAEIFDIAGRPVRTLWDGAMAAGEQGLAWNGRDGLGRPAGAGVYFVRVAVANHTARTARFVLTR